MTIWRMLTLSKRATSNLWTLFYLQPKGGCLMIQTWDGLFPFSSPSIFSPKPAPPILGSDFLLPVQGQMKPLSPGLEIRFRVVNNRGWFICHWSSVCSASVWYVTSGYRQICGNLPPLKYLVFQKTCNRYLRLLITSCGNRQACCCGFVVICEGMISICFF